MSLTLFAATAAAQALQPAPIPQVTPPQAPASQAPPPTPQARPTGGATRPETVITISRPQQWFVQPLWRCPQRNETMQRAASDVQQQMTTLGAQGWELVSFGQADVDGSTCFVAMFKKPKWQ
jgi:hypothetical protein